MTLTVHDALLQGSEEWLDQRRGILTASAVGQLISTRTLGAIDYDCPTCGTPAGDRCVSQRSGEPIKTLHPQRGEYARTMNVTVVEPATGDYARSLTLLLAAERITGWSDPVFVSDDMWRGIEDEPRARDKYAQHYAPVTEVGFMTEDRFGFTLGYSPDGVVGDDGLIEIKSRRPKTQLATILADAVPADNMAQLQMGLLVSGRQWIDYVSYAGGMPLYVKRVYPQPQWADAITAAAARFESNVSDMVAAYRAATATLHPTDRVIEQEMRI